MNPSCGKRARQCSDRPAARAGSGWSKQWGCTAGAPAYAFVQAVISAPLRRSLQTEAETMNKKFAIAWSVLFVAWFLGGFVVHGVLLRSDYMQLTNLFRPEGDQQRYFPLMILAHVILSGAFVWIYARGVEAKPWMAQGVRFGFAVALLTVVPTYTIYFVVQPMPGEVVIRQIVCDGVLLVILGTIVAWLYRDAAKPLRAG
jgi:hypothetical protein